MALTMLEKRHVGKEVALRYLRARKKEKGIMLQEFCATRGYVPLYSPLCKEKLSWKLWRDLFLAQRKKACVCPCRGATALIRMYYLSGDLCDKRLQAGMPDLLSPCGLPRRREQRSA
jgi:hypothetical protein